MSKEKREGRPQPASEVLQTLLENSKSPLSDQFIRWKLWARWEEIVGKTIAEQTLPVGYQRGSLLVWVKNSTWMQQMVFMREPMIRTINSKLNRQFVHFIRFTLDRREVIGSTDATDLKLTLDKLLP